MERQKAKKEIFEETILVNIKRKAIFADTLQMVDNVPLFSWIDINPTELCNRSCEFCPRADRAVYPNQSLHISLDLCRKIAGELRSLHYSGAVTLCGYGEPLLHPSIIELAAYFGRDIHTELVTNGDRLTTDIIKRLTDSGIAMFVVSLYDGPHQIEYFKRLFAEAGCPEEHYVLRDRWYSATEDYGVKLTNRGGVVTRGNQAEVNTEQPCYYAHYSMTIDWNGDALLCVQDWNKKVKLGNAYSQTLLDIWRSENYKRFRNMLGKGKRRLPPCSVCNADGTLHGYNHAAAWAATEKEK